MEFDLTVSVWEVAIVAFTIVSAFIGNTYMVRQNSKDIELLKSGDIKNLHEKCNEMISETIARETFVTLELYRNEVSHLNKTLDEIRNQNNAILEYLRK